MNFQFSGSIPNDLWQSHGNTMSSQPVTEFTILNGRVTLTRANNDTRNDVNVTIVANGRRNETPVRRCVACSQSPKEIRWRNRRRQDTNTLMSSIRDLKFQVYDSNEKLSQARKKLKDLQTDIGRLKDDIYRKKSKVNKANTELAKAITDLKNPDLYRLNEDDAAILRFNLNLARGELEEAKKNVVDAEKDLTNLVPYEPPDLRDEREIDQVDESVIALLDGNETQNSDGFAIPTVSSLENINNENSIKCSVCLVSAVNSVLYKCGHMCTCYECALKLQQSSDYRKCPVCRSVIIDIIKLFLS